MTMSSRLTTLLVQNDLSLELPTFIQSFLHLRGEAVAGLAAVQEVTHAALLHQLASGEAGQFAEAIGAVDYGVEGLDLGVPQDKITVWLEGRWEGNMEKTQGRETQTQTLGKTLFHQSGSSEKNTNSLISSTLNQAHIHSHSDMKGSLTFSQFILVG